MNAAGIRKEEQDTLQPFFSWKDVNPGRPFYFLDPAWLWDIGDFMQKLISEPLETAVPSSGFLGELESYNVVRFTCWPFQLRRSCLNRATIIKQ
jgi:hypothetical protein